MKKRKEKTINASAMKTLSNIFRSIVIVSLFVAMYLPREANGQVPPPPPPPAGGQNNGHGMGGNQGPTGAGAPIGGGMEIIFALGALYAGKKVYQFRRAKEE